MQRPDLATEMASAARSLTLLHLKRLEGLGVPWSHICDATAEGALGIVRATEGEDETFYPDPDGAPHLVLPIIENGALVDLVAFRSGDPGRWLLRCGLGTALGLDTGMEPHTWLLPGEAAFLHKTPLDWLVAGRDGLVIVDWSAPDLRQLCGIPHIVCEDAALAQRLRVALTRPAYLPTISIKKEALAHAA